MTRNRKRLLDDDSPAASVSYLGYRSNLYRITAVNSVTGGQMAGISSIALQPASPRLDETRQSNFRKYRPVSLVRECSRAPTRRFIETGNVGDIAGHGRKGAQATLSHGRRLRVRSSEAP